MINTSKSSLDMEDFFDVQRLELIQPGTRIVHKHSSRRLFFLDRPAILGHGDDPGSTCAITSLKILCRVTRHISNRRFSVIFDIGALSTLSKQYPSG